MAISTLVNPAVGTVFLDRDGEERTLVASEAACLTPSCEEDGRILQAVNLGMGRWALSNGSVCLACGHRSGSLMGR